MTRLWLGAGPHLPVPLPSCCVTWARLLPLSEPHLPQQGNGTRFFSNTPPAHLTLPASSSGPDFFPWLPVPATTDDRCSWLPAVPPSQGCTSSHSRWEEPAYLSPHSASASECLCWATLSTCLLPLSLRFLIREVGPPLTSGQSWVGVWMPLLEESPSRWALHLVHLCLHTSPGLDRQDTGISGSPGTSGSEPQPTAMT